jgi:hypothetical protein
MLRCALISLVLLTVGVSPGLGHAHAQPSSTEQNAAPGDTQAETDETVQAEADADALAKHNAQDARTQALQLQLDNAARERADASTLWPWVLTGGGIAMLVLGVAVGAAGSIDCEDSCRGPAWPALMVIGGGTLASAGALWVSIATREINELDARRHDLQYQLQNQRWDSAQRAGGPHLALLLHGAF